MELQNKLRVEVLSHIKDNPDATKATLYRELSMGAEYEVMQLVESGFLEDLSVSYPTKFITGGGPYSITSKGHSFLSNKKELDIMIKRKKKSELLKFLIPTVISIISLVISITSKI